MENTNRIVYNSFRLIPVIEKPTVIQIEEDPIVIEDEPKKEYHKRKRSELVEICLQKDKEFTNMEKKLRTERHEWESRAKDSEALTNVYFKEMQSLRKELEEVKAKAEKDKEYINRMVDSMTELITSNNNK